jgi:hypothetical protein
MTISLQKLADEAMELHNDEWNPAAEYLTDILAADQISTSLALKYAARYLVRESSHTRRRAIRSAKRAENLERLGGWYEYPLQGGKHLGDATRADLRSEIAWHRLLAQANGQKARWYGQLLKRLKNDTDTVSKVLPASKIGELYDKLVPEGETA